MTSSNTSPFVIKLNSAGSPQWASSFNASVGGAGKGISLTSAGYPTVCGGFQGSMVVGSTNLSSIPSKYDGFVFQLDTSGQP